MTKLIVEMEMKDRCIDCQVRLACKRYIEALQTMDGIYEMRKKIGSHDCLIKGVLPDVPEKDRQSVLDFLRECRADWIHDPSVGLFGPNEGEAALMDAIEAALEVAKKQQ